MEIKDIDKSKFLLDRNEFLSICYDAIKKIELKSSHASDDTCKRMQVFCLNQINHQIELLKRTNIRF